MTLNQPTEFKRGDIYWVRMDNGVGSEMGVGRPALIVSSDHGCKTSPVLNVVWLSTRPPHCTTDIDLGWTTKRRSVAKCSDVACVDKTRFGDYTGRPTDEMLAKVDEALAKCLGLPYSTNHDELLDEIESQQDLIDEMQSEILKLKMELAVANRMYDVALDKIVELRTKEFEPVQPKVVEPVVEEPKKSVDLNRCGMKDLTDIGVPAVVASRIVENRPYRVMEDVARVDGVTNMMYSLLKNMAVLSPVEVVETKKKPAPPSWNEFRGYPAELQVDYINDLRQELGANGEQIAQILGITTKQWSNYMNYNTSLKDPVKYRKKTPESVAKVEAYLNRSRCPYGTE